MKSKLCDKQPTYFTDLKIPTLVFISIIISKLTDQICIKTLDPTMQYVLHIHIHVNSNLFEFALCFYIVFNVNYVYPS